LVEAEGSGQIGMARTVDLAIVDRSRLRRDCLKLAFAQHGERWRVTDMAGAVELVRLVEAGYRADVILYGEAVCAQVDLADIALIGAAAPGVPVLVCADCDDAQRARAILRTGARGFLPTTLGFRVLLGAVERVYSGGVYVPSALAATGLGAAAPLAEPWGELTRRQRDVLALISQGKSNKLIADALAMSEATVKAHVKQIIRRLNVANRTQAALLAIHGSRRNAARAGRAQPDLA
jgi:DNA-binding NarL/FixJ family response regulator